ncbi:VOC family protein [Flavobacterium sp. XGLA_31]|uniref:VOC family protein n=1 Tax=Flavobacterium sp. XGLA_31 TaxID=3447666 RepID=UPI003F2D7CC3
MTKELWLNLPVKDVLLSRAFFTQLGLPFNPRHTETDATAQCLMIGKTVVMLFPEATFRQFAQHPVSDTQTASQVLISIDAESREEVDALAQKAKAAGGTVFAEPGETMGWLYGCGFCDLDGHRWNVLYMDFNKMPKE